MARRLGGIPSKKLCTWALAMAVGAGGAFVPYARATISLAQVSNTDWNIGNGALNIVYDPAGGKITSIKVAGLNTNILDPGGGHTELYPEFAGTPFGAGTQSFRVQQTAGYIDVSTTTASTGTAANPLTYSFHYVMFNNDPGIECYEVVSHSATDPATSVGQGQFLMRVNSSLFTNTYQVNTSVNNIGVQASTFSNRATYSADQADPGRKAQDATTDVTGSGIAGDFGTHFTTKYDFSSYEQLHQAQLEYGPTYAISTIIPNHDTMTGGPTKQNLQFTDNILMQEFLSGHYGGGSYSYTPQQGVDSTRLFGPYVFRITTTKNETPAQLYQDDLNTIPGYNALFDTDAALAANGYVASTSRGTVNFTISSSAGWSANIDNNTVVLSDNAQNFQHSHQGYQYWGQVAANGTASIPSVVPGTYRASVYQLGQWGETRYNNVVVAGGLRTNLPALKFVPENFSTAAPIFTIGTPNRSANEFLNGHNAAGGDIRAFSGSYDYWAEEQTLGNPGKVVYYGTAVGSTPATNDPNKWISNQWGKFNPGMYDATNDTADNYTHLAPAYVTAAGGPGTYGGAPWEVHFTTTTAQKAQGQYVVLSVGLAAADGSLTVSLNGHGETWHVINGGDPAVRSGEAGYYQFLAFQFSTSDLTAAGADNVFTFSVSQNIGVLYDAMRMEITNTSAAPATRGWFDYEYINGGTTGANDAVGETAVETFAPEPASVSMLMLAVPAFFSRRRGRAK